MNEKNNFKRPKAKKRGSCFPTNLWTMVAPNILIN